MLAPDAPANNTYRPGSSPVVVGIVPSGATCSVPIPKALLSEKIPPHMRTGDPEKVRVKCRVGKTADPYANKLCDYAAPYKFMFEERFISSIAELFDLLQECSRPDRVIVMGELTDPWRSNQSGMFQRLSVGSGGTIARQPGRLLTLDLDEAKLPGFDPLNPIPSIEEYVLPVLGEAFTRCGYICQLTTGQKTEVGSTARVRLWFFMQDMMDFDGRMRLVRQLKNIDASLNIDASSCNIVQQNYTSPPIVVPELTMDTLFDPEAFRVPDFLNNRLFMVDGPTLEVSAPPVVVEWKDSSGATSGFQLFMAGSELDALEGEGEEVHEKVRTCTYNLARNRGNSITSDDVVKLVHARLMELSEAGQPLEKRRSRIASRELQNEIKNAFNSAVRKMALHSGGLTVEESKGVPLPVAEKLLTERFREALADTESRVHVIKATCGLGKTRTALQLVKEEAGVCYMFLPDHKKAAEVVVDARALGISTIHIKGRAREHEDGTPLCMKSESIAVHPGDKRFRYLDSGMTCAGVKVEKVQDEWGSVKSEYKKVFCPHYDECGYNAQFRSDAKLYVFTHANLQHPLRETLPKPSLSIIDEDPCNTLRVEEEFKTEDLFDWDDMYTSDCISELANAITAGEDLMTTFIKHVFDRADYCGIDAGQFAEELIKRIRRKARGYMRRKMGGVTPDMGSKETLSLVGRKPVVAPWVSIIEVISRCWFGLSNTSPEVRLERNTRTNTTKVTVRRMSQPKCALGKKVILLDATPHEVGLRHIFGGFKMHEFEVQENYFEIQVLKPSFSDSTIKRMVADQQVRMGDLMAFTRMIGKQDGSGVITRKGYVEAMPTSVEGYKMPTMTFGALRGQNAMEKRNVLLSLGRLLVPSEAAEGDAAAIYPDINLQDGGKQYQPSPAKYLVRTGDGRVREMVRESVEMRHPDPRVEFEKSQRLLGEYKQAKGRLRAVRAGEKKLILNLCNVATGEPVDMLVDELTDLIGPERMVSIMERQMGCLPLRPKYLFETFPEHFETLVAAQEFVKDVRQWWESADRRFFLMIHEQPADITATTSWRKGYRKGAAKSEGKILRIRFWEEVRRDPDLGREKSARIRDFMLPSPGCDMTFADTY